MEPDTCPRHAVLEEDLKRLREREEKEELWRAEMRRLFQNQRDDYYGLQAVLTAAREQMSSVQNWAVGAVMDRLKPWAIGIGLAAAVGVSAMFLLLQYNINAVAQEMRSYISMGAGR